MDKEKFDRLKEEEKEHLRQIKELKRRLKSAEGALKAKNALRNIEGAADMDELNEALDAVARESLDAEVRLDLAMDMAGKEPIDPSMSPEEIRKRKADELIAQMKAHLLPDAGKKETGPATPAEQGEDEAGDLPEKTIGRMKPGDDPEEEPLPDKTIGRMGAGHRGSEDR